MTRLEQWVERGINGPEVMAYFITTRKRFIEAIEKGSIPPLNENNYGLIDLNPSIKLVVESDHLEQALDELKIQTQKDLYAQILKDRDRIFNAPEMLDLSIPNNSSEVDALMPEDMRVQVIENPMIREGFINLLQYNRVKDLIKFIANQRILYTEDQRKAKLIDIAQMEAMKEVFRAHEIGEEYIERFFINYMLFPNEPDRGFYILITACDGDWEKVQQIMEEAFSSEGVVIAFDDEILKYPAYRSPEDLSDEVQVLCSNDGIPVDMIRGIRIVRQEETDEE